MNTPPTLMRRLLGATLSLGLAAGGMLATATLAAAPASAAGGDSCTATMSPASIRPGQSATLTVTTSEDRYLPAIIVVNGHVVPGATVGINTQSNTQPYSWWEGFGSYAEVLHPTTAGYRIFSGEVDNTTATDATEYLCQGVVTFLPAATAQTVSFAPVANTPLTTGSLTVSATATSGLPVTLASLSQDVCQVAPATGVVTLLAQGECRISGEQAGDEDYAASPTAYLDFYVQGTQTITFPAVADQILGAPPVDLNASVNSGRYLTVVSNTQTVCTVVDDAPRAARRDRLHSRYQPTTVQLLAVGTCSITVSQGGEPGWLPATPVTRTFKIKPVVAPAVSLTAPSGAPLSAGSVKVKASSTVEGPISIRSLTPAVCTVSGTTATLRKAGTCTVRGTQADATSDTKSFRVWPTPALPAKGKATTVVTVLGAGEDDLTLRATPASVCRADGAKVLLIAAGSCKVRVAKAGTVLRSGTIKVTFPKKSKPSDQLELAGTAYFAFDSAKLTAKAKKTLRGLVPELKQADLVVVYGNTYGPGKNSKHSKELSAARAKAVVAYLSKRGVKAKAVKVAAAMKNPVSSKAAKNRRVDIYVVKKTVVS